MAGSLKRTLFWSLLVALGCGGGGGSGCTGCGSGGCLEPIPGGFPADQRKASAVTAKITSTGFDLIESQVQAQVAAAAGGAALNLPCTDGSQRITIGSCPFCTHVDIKLYVCDLSDDRACTAADDNPALRIDEPGHGIRCQAATEVRSVGLSPVQNADGTVDLETDVGILVKTGKIPLTMDSPVCDLKCSIEFDSDKNPPATVPIKIRVKLKIEPTSGDILSFDLGGIDKITDAIDENELQIVSEGGGCSFTCDIVDVDLIKRMLFDRVQGQITRQIRDQIDTFRCVACEAGTNACPTGAHCEEDQGVCYFQYEPSDNPASDKRFCPPALLGLEGRANVGGALPIGGGDAKLDLSIVAGGKNPDGKPTHRVQAGGLVLGMLGGSGAPLPSNCVPAASWPRRPDTAPMDFDAEAQVAIGGVPVGAYDIGFALSDDFLDKMAYDAWRAGVLCAELGTEQVELVSSGLFGTFIRSLGVLTHGQDVPMILALRPKGPPTIVIGKGTTKPGPDGTPIPDDPLLTIELKDLQIDFYALVEERQVRIFSLIADVKLPLSLEFNATERTVLPVLAGLDTLLTNVRAINTDILADDPRDLETVLGSLMGLVQPQIAGALTPIAMPDAAGFAIDVKSARGSVPLANPPGYAHMAMFTKITAAPPAPLRITSETFAELVASDVPTLAELRGDARRPPKATLALRAEMLQSQNFQGYEYSWRVDGGLWHAWTRSTRLELAPQVLYLQGRHDIEVRSRAIDAPESTDPTPAIVTFDVDYEAPRVSLEATDAEVRTLAHDAVTPDDALSFRYRLDGADWSEAGPAQVFALDAIGERALMVEVTDEAGHVATATYGRMRSIDDATIATSSPDANGGCTTVGGSLLALFALVGLIARRRR